LVYILVFILVQVKKNFIYVCYQCLDKSVGKPGVGVNPADTYLINACTKIILSQHFIMTIFLV
jgi:hypothetical protein